MFFNKICHKNPKAFKDVEYSYIFRIRLAILNPNVKVPVGYFLENPICHLEIYAFTAKTQTTGSCKTRYLKPAQESFVLSTSIAFSQSKRKASRKTAPPWRLFVSAKKRSRRRRAKALKGMAKHIYDIAQKRAYLTAPSRLASTKQQTTQKRCEAKVLDTYYVSNCFLF